MEKVVDCYGRLLKFLFAPECHYTFIFWFQDINSTVKKEIEIKKEIISGELSIQVI